MRRLDISGTLDGIEWMPAFDKVRELSTAAVVRCGESGCGRQAGYHVAILTGGLEVLIGSRALNPQLMAEETAERAADRRAVRGRHAGTWLGYVAIPLDGPVGGPVVLTRAIRNAVPDAVDLERRWHSWLSTTPAPHWATRLTADCGKHTTAVHVADVVAARAEGRTKVYTRTLPSIPG